MFNTECKKRKKVPIHRKRHDLRLNMYVVDFVPDNLAHGSLIKLLWFNSHNFCGL